MESKLHLSAHLCTIGTTYYFRLTTPPDLLQIFGKRYLKHSLKTSDPKEAKVLAYALHSAYLEKFKRIRGAMSRDPKEEAARLNTADSFLDGIFKEKTVAPSLQSSDAAESLPDLNISKFDVDAVQLPDGTYHWDVIRTNSTPQDLADGQAKADRLNALKAIPSWAKSSVVPVSVPTLAPARSTSELLSVCIDWFKAIKQASVREDTWKKYEADLQGFLKLIGDREVEAIHRAHLSRFKDHLESIGNSKKTCKDKLSNMGVFFKELIRASKYSGPNPAEGQVSISTTAKKVNSRVNGRKSFRPEQIQKIFEPENYKQNIEPAEYWVPIIQLYTGARCNEVCQLLSSDFVTIEGYKCFVILDEEIEELNRIYKRTKEESSRRLIPLHPDLLELGLWDYVQKVRKLGHQHIFPYILETTNGYATRQLHAFTAYLKHLEIDVQDGKVGTHAFRKFLIRYLQAKKVGKELRKLYVGHSKNDTFEDSFDVHTDVYEYEQRAKEIVEGIFPHLNFSLDLKRLARPHNSFDKFITQDFVSAEHEKTRNRQKAQKKKALEKKQEKM